LLRTLISVVVLFSPGAVCVGQATASAEQLLNDLACGSCHEGIEVESDITSRSDTVSPCLTVITLGLYSKRRAVTSIVRWSPVSSPVYVSAHAPKAQLGTRTKSAVKRLRETRIVRLASLTATAPDVNCVAEYRSVPRHHSY